MTFPKASYKNVYLKKKEKHRATIRNSSSQSLITYNPVLGLCIFSKRHKVFINDKWIYKFILIDFTMIQMKAFLKTGIEPRAHRVAG